MSNRIRILFLSSNTWNTSRLHLEKELRGISERLEESPSRDKFELINYPILRAADLQRLLIKHQPHIVHFAGHGSLAEEIILEGSSRRGRQIEPQALASVFRLLKDHVRIVVLNACSTASQAMALTEVVDYTIGIRNTIGDRAAVTFAAGFYGALGFGTPIKQAFESAAAELKLAKLSRSKGIELFVRNGVNENEPFPIAAGAAIDDSDTLKAALKDLLAGNSNEDQTNHVREAMLDGTLILGQTDEPVGGETRIFETSAIRGSGKALRAEVDYLTYRHLQEQLFPSLPGIGPPFPGLMVVGREGAMADVKALLQSNQAADTEVNLTVVRGWPGVGKTTLVGVLGRDPEILKHFPDGVLWTDLERKPELMTKLAEWGRALGTDELLRMPTLDQAVVKLAALMRHRRMLLIIDGIWDSAHAVPFIRAATGTSCAVLATTRLTEVAEELTVDDQRIYVLPELSEEDSLSLLRYLAPSVVEQYPEQCRELAGDLDYLPLALQVAGRLLKAEAKMGLSVGDLIEGIRSGASFLDEHAPIDLTEGTVLPTVQALLKRSTDELDERARDCFAVLSVFAPKPTTFSLDAAAAVWQVEDPKVIIRQLVGHGLLEPVGEGRFQIGALLVQHARALLTQ